MHCFVVNIYMNIKCMQEKRRVCSQLLILAVTKCFGASSSFAKQRFKGKGEKQPYMEQWRWYGNTVILYSMKFIDLKVFSVPPVLEWDSTNQSVKL